MEDVSGLINDSFYRRHWSHGKRLDGDWDIETIRRFVFPFRDDTVGVHIAAKHRGIYQRFIEGRDWDETDLFTHVYERRMREEGNVKGCQTMGQLVDYYTRYDKLFTEISERGIRPPSFFEPGIGPMTVHVGRESELLYGIDGHHRLAMCVVLGYMSIPVFLGAVHRRASGSWKNLFFKRR